DLTVYARSIILYQIHPAIQLSNLITITIKNQRVSQSELSYSPLRLLAPPRMIAVGIYVRIKTVLARPSDVPRCRRLILHKSYPYDRLGSFEAILRRHNQSWRGSVLRRQGLAVESACENRKRMQRLIQSQAFDIGPVQRI